MYVKCILNLVNDFLINYWCIHFPPNKTIIFIRNQIHLLKAADQQVLHQMKFQL